MRSNPLKPLAVLAALLALAVLAQHFGGDGSGRRAGSGGGETGFDFYVLALSWSPSYCEIEGADADREQCSAGRPFAFVLHGLWPQYEKGYPRDCPSRPGDGPDNALVRSMLDIMPAAGLVRHEWRAHGTCSGLDAAAYFARARAAYDHVAIPDRFRRLDQWTSVTPKEVERAFVAANPGLGEAMIAPVCGKRFLSEVRVCLTTALQFRACPEIDRDSCRLDKAVMPPVRN